MRPLGPVPLTCAIVTPNSRANLRTDGLAWLGPSLELADSARAGAGVEVGADTTAGAGIGAAGGATVFCTGVAGAACGAGVGGTGALDAADTLASLGSRRRTKPPSEILSPTLT